MGLEVELRRSKEGRSRADGIVDQQTDMAWYFKSFKTHIQARVSLVSF